MRHPLAAALLALLLLAGTAGAQEAFRDVLGDAPVGDVSLTADDAIPAPFLTWGGDVATMLANGGETTQPDSIYADLGLDVVLRNGDDFPAQVRAYLAGDTPLLRGTLRMIGQASGVLGADPRTKPVVFMQLTWSAGDHLVSRGGLETLEDLKGATIALQRGGPHVGMLDDALRAARLSWDDITAVFVDDLTGPGGPAERFRTDDSIDAAAVISPDMIGLTGGLDATGSGAEGTVRGARVLVSTAQMSRSIADVYACRKDWYDANRPWIEKFVAGYFKASEQLVELRDSFEGTGRGDAYLQILAGAQRILGEDVLPTLEVDAHGLLLDATFVGLPGNRAFFEDAGNLAGFAAKQDQALDLAVERGYAEVRAGFFPPALDYARIAELGGLKKLNAASEASGGRVNAEGADLFPDDAQDGDTLLSFTIGFEPNQTEFSAAAYGPEFLRAVQTASTFGNAVVAIRGHSDPTKVLVDLVKAGLTKGVLKRQGASGDYRYFFAGRELDLNDRDAVEAAIQTGAFAGVPDADPAETLAAARSLSRSRAAAVRDALVKFASDEGLRLDATQIQPVGVGVAEPVIAKPSNMAEARQNMRVEFRLVKVPAEVLGASDFDF